MATLKDSQRQENRLAKPPSNWYTRNTYQLLGGFCA